MDQGKSLRLGNQPQKLIPKDLSESLAKLPPQATDLEAIVLGAIMLESHALEKVKFLKPQHFYEPRHREVFNAILQLKSLGEPHDFRMVVMQLRKNGQLEFVGGPSFPVELTAGVSSAASIEHHARVVVEMAIKRFMIEKASDIHTQAYDLDSDPVRMLDNLIDDLTFLRDRETKSDGPERIKLLWQKYGITTEPNRPEPLIALNGAVVCTVGNISLLVGKKKARKTLLMVYLIWEFLKNQTHVADQIAVFDTEQEEYDVWQIRDKLYRLTSQYVSVFCLRGLSPTERREFISNTVTHWPTKLKLCVIDGIRDCMSNINDPDETTDVMSWLMKMNVETGVHFINVLHLNKTDDNARGHIGTELLNKAEVTIQVDYQQETGFSLVKCESSRRKPFDEFLFTHSPTGLPEVVGAPSSNKEVDSDAQIRTLQLVFEDEALHGKQFAQGICDQFQVGMSKARKMIAQFIQRGWVVKSGKSNSPNTTYKLIVKPKAAVSQDVNSVNTVDQHSSKAQATQLHLIPPTAPPPDEEPDWVKS